MIFFEKFVLQSHWNENIAAILTTYCRFFNLEISNQTIFENYRGKEKMAHFNQIIAFCTAWNIEYIHLNLVKEHLAVEFLPAFVLMNGYRTVLVMYVKDDIVYYVDAETGWQERSTDDFMANSMGHIILVDHENYIKEGEYHRYEAKEKARGQCIPWTRPEIIELTRQQNFGKLILKK